MPHNANKEVRDWDFIDDFHHYYHNTIVTLNGEAALVREVQHTEKSRNRSYEDLLVTVKVIPQKGDGRIVQVNGADLDYRFPDLGWVKTSDGWFYVSRRPRRRRTKGYCNYVVSSQNISGHWEGPDLMSTAVVRQIWYGNTERINNDCIVLGDRIMYGAETVCTIANNEVRLVEGKEKLGRFSCKLLRNRMEEVNSLRNLIIHD